MGLIPNDWKHLFRTERLSKLSNKEIYFILQSKITNYIKPFKFISWPNFLEVSHILSPDI